MKLYHRIRYFFQLWRHDYYGEPMSADFAWAVAGAKADHHDTVSRWMEAEIGGDDD